MNNKKEDLIKKIVYLMETDDSDDAPVDSRQWAKNLFRGRVGEPKKSLAQRVLAVLQMDLSPDKAAFGERSSATQEARQVLFGAGENGIDLRISPAAKGFSVKGQILGENFANAEITLIGGENSYTARTGELSEFGFPEISARSYQIILKSGDRQIIIENIEIG